MTTWIVAYGSIKRTFADKSKAWKFLEDTGLRNYCIYKLEAIS